jgi:hypothetical protein
MNECSLETLESEHDRASEQERRSRNQGALATVQPILVQGTVDLDPTLVRNNGVQRARFGTPVRNNAVQRASPDR